MVARLRLFASCALYPECILMKGEVQRLSQGHARRLELIIILNIDLSVRYFFVWINMILKFKITSQNPNSPNPQILTLSIHVFHKEHRCVFPSIRSCACVRERECGVNDLSHEGRSGGSEARSQCTEAGEGCPDLPLPVDLISAAVFRKQ